MAKTYETPADGQWDNPIHEVRFWLRDTSPGAMSLDDDELQLLLDRLEQSAGVADVFAAAAQAAEVMANSYVSAGTTSKAVGNTSISRTYSGEADRYWELAARLWGRSAVGRQEGALHGIGMASGEQPPRQFAMGHMDTPGAGDTIWWPGQDERLRVIR